MFFYGARGQVYTEASAFCDLQDALISVERLRRKLGDLFIN